MLTRTIFLAVLAALVFSPVVEALNPDDELWVPAAVRGDGHANSFWITDLYIMNLSEEAITVEVTWLQRWVDNSEAEGIEFDIEEGETLVLDDVIADVFGLQAAQGAFHIEALEEDDQGEEDGDSMKGLPIRFAAMDDEGEGEEDDDVEFIASARIYNLKDGTTFGQGLEGLFSDAAISAEDEDPTHVIGVSENDTFRTNWFGLNITMDEDDEAMQGRVLVEVLDLAGQVITDGTFTMAPLAPVLFALSDLGVDRLDNGSLRFTMLEGDGLFGAAKVDRVNNDATNLEAHWDCEEDEDDEEFSSEFFIDECTFSTTGRNPFFVLEPGFEIVLEGEEDGVEIAAEILVLNSTFEVDGVETRVVVETETEDGELVEISRNYFAICEETGSVFYFGEHVDDYEDGVVVGHEGEWLAGVDGATAGIIMPGTPLLGSRYFQEIAPGVAMDRAEHVAEGLEVETEAGAFEGCIRVLDSSPLDPGEEDEKVYCPGIGIVIDEDLELVEFTDPSQG